MLQVAVVSEVFGGAFSVVAGHRFMRTSRAGAGLAGLKLVGFGNVVMVESQDMSQMAADDGSSAVDSGHDAGAAQSSGAGVARFSPPQGGAGGSGGRFLPPTARRPRPPKLYRIGEVVSYSGVSRQTIHNYTTMGLLHETKWTDGGHRLYDESVFERLDQIAAMKAQNRSLGFMMEHFAGVDSPKGL